MRADLHLLQAAVDLLFDFRFFKVSRADRVRGFAAVTRPDRRLGLVEVDEILIDEAALLLGQLCDGAHRPFEQKKTAYGVDGCCFSFNLFSLVFS